MRKMFLFCGAKKTNNDIFVKILFDGSITFHVLNEIIYILTVVLNNLLFSG